MLPTERSTRDFPFIVINDGNIDFCSIEKDFGHDSHPDKLFDSIGKKSAKRKVVSCNQADDNTLLSIFADEESRHISPHANQTALDPAPSQMFDSVALNELSEATEGQQIISDDEDDRPIEAFPDDESSYVYQYKAPQQLPSQASDMKFATVPFNCDVTCTFISSSNSDFIDAFQNENKHFQHTKAISSKEIEGIHSDVTVSIENHNFKQNKRFRDYQKDRWDERYKELTEVFRDTGRSAVHHTDVSKKGLARWIKRQRAQYKLRQELKPSSMTDERIQALNLINFVWDSHRTAWDDRVFELETFKAIHNHCNVTPSNYPVGDSFLSWVKNQRRQYRIMKDGLKSNLTPKRIRQLECLGFQFN